MIQQILFPCISFTSVLPVPIVLLNGWGLDSRVWQSLVQDLQILADVVVIESDYQEKNVNQWCEQLGQQLPEKSILCGWSLGGMLATTFAAQYSHRVSALVTLSTNLQFVADAQWPVAVPEQTFASFHQAFKTDAKKTLKRFMGLVVQGDELIREQRRYIQAMTLDGEELDKLCIGLDWLFSINNQRNIEHIDCPTLHLFGEQDRLVPAEVERKIALLNSQHQVTMIKGAGHLLHMPSFRITSVIQNFLQEVTDECRHVALTKKEYC
ncbi:hypothetical protein AB835_04425 [Candidatus Endobugula sertula]|uniref:AB hydrolase-1 domain-containing protein n=1 Tax=Candidatus Endobugula sertula TaxID=62101 RepID=A0A1D2QRQ8_9GAMM|nr:hypothetical protein AB835_04425 [Candidatus Endobugula sertula]